MCINLKTLVIRSFQTHFIRTNVLTTKPSQTSSYKNNRHIDQES